MMIFHKFFKQLSDDSKLKSPINSTLSTLSFAKVMNIICYSTSMTANCTKYIQDIQKIPINYIAH